MAADPDCVFCRIVAGEVPAERVAEDERTIAFLDAAPATRGHVVVIPREHAAGLEAIADEDLAAVALTAQRLATAMRERLGADGVNLIRPRDDDGAAGHVHVHVVPRYHGDALRLPWVSEPGDRDEIEAAARELAG
jgi:histidine triad (HIT) family protein